TRSWFQNPNSFDNLHVGQTDPFGNPLPETDQRSQIKTFNIAPSWTRLLSNTTVFTLGAFVRRDQYNYYPSADAFGDISPIQQEISQMWRRIRMLLHRSSHSLYVTISPGQARRHRITALALPALCSAFMGTPTLNCSRCLCRTPSPKEIGPSTSVCEAMFTTDYLRTGKLSPVLASLTTLNGATPSFAFLMRGCWKLRSTRIWC